MLSLTARGELVLGGAAVAASTATGGMALGDLSILHMAGRGQVHTGGASSKKGKSSQPTAAKGPGKWTYKKPTTESRRALEYQERITGRPAWYVYMFDELEFDGFNGKELLEAKGPGYCSFFNPDGTPKSWYKSSGKFDEMMNQAEKQSKRAQREGLPLIWHVADAKVAEFLREMFRLEGWKNITVHYKQAAR
ncbi:Tox-REase-5 domain-containing protein [Cystobacter fuscus]